MRKGLRVILIMGALLALLGLAAYLVMQTDFQVADDGLVVETDFPEARCRKQLTAAFPFVTFTCEPQAE
jgi:hypothetical protein